MARAKSRVSAAQRLAGYAILAVLFLIVIWLAVQQSRFNPAVIVASRAPLTPGPPAAAGTALRATAALLPEVPGFTPQTPPESYGPDNLSDKIDGKAELYLSAGFKEMSCRSFGLGPAGATHLEVFLYDMGSPPNAFAVFSGQRRAGAASSFLTANAYATANALFFTRGQYYVEMVADRAGEGLAGSLETYARALLAKLPAEQGQGQSEADLFPPEGLARDTVRLGAADVFGLEGFNNVLTGEYTLKSGKATAFVAQRTTPAQAQAEARRYLDFLTANGYRRVEAARGPEGVPVLALEDSFEVVFVQGRLLAGVHDASSLAAAQELAARMWAALRGKP